MSFVLRLELGQGDIPVDSSSRHYQCRPMFNRFKGHLVAGHHDSQLQGASHSWAHTPYRPAPAPAAVQCESQTGPARGRGGDLIFNYLPGRIIVYCLAVGHVLGLSPALDTPTTAT